MTKLHELAHIGQSIWYDNIRRTLIESGALAALIDAGVVGVTSNPSIFDNAISGSDDYDAAIRQLAADGGNAEAIYEALALEDIAHTADLLRPVYDRTDGVDGYVSLEVSPALAHDTEGTAAAARRLFAALNRPNVMIKVPATAAGIPAIRQLIGEGVNINVTLIFSLARYEAVMEAYLAGLEAHEGDLARVASVASFFVSRVDTAVDPLLGARGMMICRAGSPSPTPRSLTAVSATCSTVPDGRRWRPGARGCSGRCGPAPAPRTRPIPIPGTWTT